MTTPKTALKIPKLGWVSLGCPKALVDSQRLMSALKTQGYQFVNGYSEADLVVVNTCGFIESAQAESLEAIGEALQEHGKVLVIGCLGEQKEKILAIHPKVAAIVGSHSYDEVVQALHQLLPPPSALVATLPIVYNGSEIRLTPKHYAYLKIAEGCSHTCTFCIIPKLRGKLHSDPISKIMMEAEALIQDGAKELIVIAQDTFAYGTDTKEGSLLSVLDELEKLGVWIRLHYLYPYPQLDRLIERMALGGNILPYLDMPLQHVSLDVLKRMKRVQHGGSEGLLRKLEQYRSICPDLTIRSSFIVGFPGETDENFEELLAFVEDAKLDRMGAFTFSKIEGAAASAMDDQVDEALKESRLDMLMSLQEEVSAERLGELVNSVVPVMLDEVENGIGVGRRKGDSPDVDGLVYIHKLPINAAAGQILSVRLTELQDAYDFKGVFSPAK